LFSTECTENIFHLIKNIRALIKTYVSIAAYIGISNGRDLIRKNWKFNLYGGLETKPPAAEGYEGLGANSPAAGGQGTKTQPLKINCNFKVKI